MKKHLHELTEIDCRKEFYEIFLNKIPRDELLKSPEDLSDEEFIELQNYVGDHQKVCVWSTNIGVIEAIESLIDGAKENANIR